MEQRVIARCVAYTFFGLFFLLSSSAPIDQKPSGKYLWISKKYNTEKVFVITESIELPGDLNVKDLKLRFKAAVYRNYGKDPNGDIEIDNSSPKSNKDAVEKSREKEMEKMKKEGWRVYTLHRFPY